MTLDINKSLPFLDLRAPYAELRDEVDAAVQRVLSRGWYLLGEELTRFEAEFAAYVSAKHCIGVANGLDALTLSLRALGVQPGDEVIVPSNTFIATWLAVTYAGGTPVPVEPDVATYNIDPARIEAAITPRTRAIVPVHLYGMPAEMGEIRTIAERHGLPLLEDAAQAHGATLHGERTGARGTCAWSFYPGKNLGALGDGGAVTTDDDGVAERLRKLRNYGSSVKYVHELAGVNSRLDEIQAAVLSVKLARLDEWNARRHAIAVRYSKELSPLPLTLPAVPSHMTSSWHLYVVRTPDRAALQSHLAAAGVESLIHYPRAPHLQGAYAGMGYGAGAFPIAESMQEQVVSLPIGPHMTDAHVSQVIVALQSFAAHATVAS